jgi:GntR family transcriptional repressor for pyruvate dehydrogenase complex
MRVNMSFHGAVARASGNPVLANVIESLIELYSSEQLAIASLYDARAQDHQDHRRIFAALHERDAVLARERMRQHLLGVKAVVEVRLAERGAAGHHPTDVQNGIRGGIA